MKEGRGFISFQVVFVCLPTTRLSLIKYQATLFFHYYNQSLWKGYPVETKSLCEC